MNSEKKYTLLEAQQEFAKMTNHRVWDLLEKPDRTSSENEELILAANTSLYHWLQVGTQVHAQRGYWLLSRVNVVLGRTQDAVDHALRCQEVTENNPDQMEDFDLAYAQESLARAYALNGDQDKAKEHFLAAENLGHKIKDKEDQDIFIGDLNSGDWYGIK